MRALSALCLLFVSTAGGSAAAEPTACRQACTTWPLRFFSGRTTGEGSLRVLFQPAQRIHVRSNGRVAKGGALILRQTIRQGDAAPSTREWRLRQTSPGRFAGTLTDAAGSVTGEVEGNRLRLRYTMKGAWRVRIEQRLELQPDGHTVQNRLTASKFGLPIASLRETIRKGR